MSAEHDHSHPHDHNHDHDQAHPGVQPDDASPPSRYELMTLAMRELLIEKGILTVDQVRRGLETLDSWQPSRGAVVVARAWTDPAFKNELLKWNYEQTVEATEFQGRKIDLVVEPKILIKSGLIK